MGKRIENINVSEEQCLSKDQLLGYSAESLGEAEQQHVERHIQGCEMCAMAAKGFTNAAPNLAMLTLLDNDLHEMVDSKLPSSGTFTIQHGLNVLLGGIIIIGGIYFFNMESETPIVNMLPVVETEAEEPETIVKPPPVTAEVKVEEVTKATEVVLKPEASKAEEPVGSYEPRTRETMSYMPLLQVQASKLEKLKEERSYRARISTNTKYVLDLKTYDYERIYMREHEETWYNPNLGVSAEYAHSTDITTYHNNPDSRTVWKTYKSILESALADYKRSKFDKCLASLNLLLEDYPSDINGLFYKGLSLFYTKKYKKSIQYMTSVAADVNPTFDQEAEWFVALAYIKLGEREIARDHLNTIIEYDGFYKKEARKKLKEIK